MSPRGAGQSALYFMRSGHMFEWMDQWINMAERKSSKIINVNTHILWFQVIHDPDVNCLLHQSKCAD